MSTETQQSESRKDVKTPVHDDLGPIDTSQMSAGKAAAMEVAEAARERSWEGDSFTRDIFLGDLRFQHVHPFPDQPDADVDAGKEFLGNLSDLLQRVDADQIDEDGDIPQEVIDELAAMGAFGIKIPTAYGGLGLSQTNYVRAAMLLGSHCGNITTLLSAHQSIGVPQPLLMAGSDEQRETYLPRVAKGEISAFALTEPAVGSDPAKMVTTAEPTEDGQHYIINGKKLWCTNGTRAGVIVVMARTPDKVVGNKARRQITAFIVDMDTPGIEIENRCRFLGLKAIYNGVLRFDNVKVPAKNIIDAEGRGLKIALSTLNTGRLTVAGACVGLAKRCLEITRQWSNEREQWGSPIGHHQAIADKIARMAAHTFAMESIVMLTSRMVDLKKADIRLESAMCKLKCTEDAKWIVDETMQIRGGRGYETAQSLKDRGERPVPIERMYRDTRINTIFEGSSEIMALLIAREALDPHLDKAGAVINPRSTMMERAKGAMSAGAFYVPWYLTRWLPSGVEGVYGLDPVLARHVRACGRLSRVLSRRMFHAMAKFGPKLERQQMLLARYVEIGTELFTMAASCSRAQSLLNENPGNREYVDLADLYCQQARRRIADLFRYVGKNDDRANYRMSKRILDGGFDWLMDGIVETDNPPMM